MAQMEIIQISHMDTEEVRQARRRARIEQMKREKRRKELLYKWGVPAIAVIAVIGIGFGVGRAAWSRLGENRMGGESRVEEESGNIVTSVSENTGDESAGQGMAQGTDMDEAAQVGAAGALEAEPGQDVPLAGGQPAYRAFLAPAGRGFPLHAAASVVDPMRQMFPSLGGTLPVEIPARLGEPANQPYVFEMTEDTGGFSETILSTYGIIIDVEKGAVLAQKAAYERMNPASMTKILTVLVAAEHLTEADLDETATITIDITDYSFVNDCSNTGFARDEVVTVRDLFYGTILPSGADSALALAIYVAGSHEAFVDMMNEKLAQLGLAQSSHFTNCVGIYDENHYTTAYDMAIMLKAATDNPFLRDVMSAHTYTTSQTLQHPEGLRVSNWFLRRIEDRDTHGEVLCGKTGYVDQSGSCAASLGLDGDGREYLCVTADSNSPWTCIADHVELYQRFLPPMAGETGEGS